LVVNGGIGLLGNLNVGGNVAITGTITLGGGGNTVSTSSLSVDNPMIFLGSNNAADILDLGFVGEYTSSGKKYAGLVRDASDSGIFKLFANNSTRPNNAVNFSDANVAYGTLLVGTLRANNNISSTSNTTGTLVVTGGVGISENLNVGANVTVTGLATFTGGIRAQEIQEDVVDTTQGSNVIACDYSAGNIFYRTSTNFSANFTMNITNAPTTDGRVFSITLFQTQGSTGYRPTTLNINGSSATIKWVGGSAPTPTSSSGAMDVFSFTVIRRGAAYEVLATSTLNFA
jgi:cytoskeletal protein CcmA (bactofilin family)